MERLLGHAILARMITDHRQNPAGPQGIAKGRQRRGQPFQFLVDGNPDRLEEAGEIPRPRGGAEGTPDRVHEVVAGGKRGPLPAANDLAGQPRRPALIAPIAKPASQLLLGGGIQQVGSGGAVLPHPHVQLSAGAEAEPPGVLIELPGGDAKVQEDGVRPERRHRLERLGGGIGGLHDAEVRVGEPPPGNGDRVGVAIDAKHPGTPGEEGGGVTAITKGAIDDPLGAGKRLEDRLQQDRQVKRRGQGDLAGSGMHNTPPAEADGVLDLATAAGLTGLEPATSAVTVRHSNQAELQPLLHSREIYPVSPLVG